MNKARLFTKSARVRVCICLLMTLALCLTQLVPYGLATEKVNAAVTIYPNGSDLTVTKVVLAPAESQTINVQLKGLAGNIANNINCGFNWGNAFDCFGDWILDSSDGSPASFEQAWGNPCATKEMIHKISAAGYKAVRFPVTWAQHIDDANGYKVDEAWMSRVQQVVTMQHVVYLLILIAHHLTAQF